MKTPFFCAGRSEDPPGSWETLCPDVRELIISKLSLREHACAAPVCREFQEQLLPRVAETRASCISLAEETFGKGLICAFVTAVQRMMCGLGPTLQEGFDTLLIDAAGASRVFSEDYLMERRGRRRHGAHLRKWGNGRVLQAVLYRELPEPDEAAGVWMDFFQTSDGRIGV
jgi:hypothetical protein